MLAVYERVYMRGGENVLNYKIVLSYMVCKLVNVLLYHCELWCVLRVGTGDAILVSVQLCIARLRVCECVCEERTTRR